MPASPRLAVFATVLGVMSASAVITAVRPGAGLIAAALAAVTLVTTVLVWRGRVARNAAGDEREFFTANGALISRDTHDSLGSTWIMLGNVVVANMFLGQLLGIATVWMLLTWAWAFLVLSRHVVAIRQRPLPDETLHRFLRRAYDSRAMQIAAAAVTIVVGIGVYAIELILGTALLVAFMPGMHPIRVSAVLIGVVVAGMVAATRLGGLRAIVESDAVLWFSVIAAVLLLPILTWGANIEAVRIYSWREAVVPLALTLRTILAVGIGLFLLQVPLLVGDYGTWQRVRATSVQETPRLGRRLWGLAIWQILLWGAPVVAGILVLAVSPTATVRSGPLYTVGAPLIEVMAHWNAVNTIPEPIRVAAGCLVLIGLLAVMLTTADGYLMIALEAWVRDIRPLAVDSERATVARARRMAALFAFVGCIAALILGTAGGSLIGMIATFFGALVALASPTLLALYEPESAARWSRSVVSATIIGFAMTISFGLIITFALPAGSEWDWWRYFGPFLVPVPAMVIPLLTIVSHYVGAGDWKACSRFVSLLVLPAANKDSAS